MKPIPIVVALVTAILVTDRAGAQELIFTEAESFEQAGGWVVDQQFMDLMGSPYMLAHGLGVPVKDATTVIRMPAEAAYRVWVRSRDWVAPWRAPGAPGRFQLLINGAPLRATFGTAGAEWHWQDGGLVELSGQVEVALHDLTGFEGRCDAIIFTTDKKFIPPDRGPALVKLRSKHLGWDTSPKVGGHYDLVVVGGGIAGTSAAITAARLGLQVALIQDRPVLGGNGSSEVRVWPEGHTNQEPYPRVGDVVSELIRKKGPGDGNAKGEQVYEDARKLKLARAEPNLTLLLEHRVNNASVSDHVIGSVIAQQTQSGKRTIVSGKWFLDSTGDGVLGALVGADFEMTEVGHMGMSNLWNLGETEENEFQLKCECEDEDALSSSFSVATTAQPFPRCPWAIDLSDKAFPGRKKHAGQWGGKNPLANLGGWFWESGYDKHPIDDAEWTRDLNLRAMYGAWDTLKNVDGMYPNHRLKWAAFIAGKRESRRLLGDVMITANDFRKGTEFEDAAFPCTWGIDLHLPDSKFFKRPDVNAFISRATEGKQYKYEGPYWAPYRCLYSRNISNLFMAGRNISVSHDGLGPVRVMRTCGMMGEIVGMASSICKERDCQPREVYSKYLNELKALMTRGAGREIVSAEPKDIPKQLASENKQ